jgi:small subunit ribosomal protein S4
MGFARTRSEARQLVRHRHVEVNGKRVSIPSYVVKPGDKVSIREKSRNKAVFTDSLEQVDRRGLPDWVELDKEKFEGTVKALPNREEITLPIQEQLIVEFYSR